MIDQHPITPPPELEREWCQQGRNCTSELDALKALATQAARWGADQELEACCEWLAQLRPQGDVLVTRLRAARRPKPPSLKEQALSLLNDWCEERNGPGESCLCDGLHVLTIRRALEALDD